MNAPSLTPAKSRIPDWFVRTDARPGIPASRSDLHGQVEGLVDGLGAALRRLHEVDLGALSMQDTSSNSDDAVSDSDSGLDPGHGASGDVIDASQARVSSSGAGSMSDAWDALANTIRKNVAAGNVDASSLPHPYSRYDAEKLLEFWLEGKPEEEELVLSHGNPRLDNFYFDGADFVGASNLANVCYADRHLDLAVLHHEIHEHLGAEAVFRFYEAYGRDPILLRLDHYLLASYLLTTGVGPT